MKLIQYSPVLILLMIFNTANADQIFYGIALINQKVTQDVNIISPASTTTVKDTGSGIGIYADYYYKGSYRFNGTVSYVGYDNFDVSTLTASADYLFPMDTSFTLFTGITAGGAAMKFSDANLSNTSVGTLYGVQAGAIIFLSNGIMLELGYRLRSANIETELLSPAGTSTVDELNETYLNLVITL